MASILQFRRPSAVSEAAGSRPAAGVGRFALFTAGAIVAFGAIFLWRSRRESSLYRRQALAELRTLRQGIQAPQTRVNALAALPQLVRGTCEALADPQAMRALSGQEWLQFLDSTWPGDSFSNGPGRVLATLSYSNRAGLAAVSQEEAEELFELVRRWIRGHRRPVQRMARDESR